MFGPAVDCGGAGLRALPSAVASPVVAVPAPGCGVIAIGLAAAGSLLQGYKGPLKRWLVIGIVLVFLMPLALWETFFPPPFDITVCSDTVDYEFRDPDCAVEFAALNLSEPTEASEAEDGSGGHARFLKFTIRAVPAMVERRGTDGSLSEKEVRT